MTVVGLLLAVPSLLLSPVAWRCGPVALSACAGVDLSLAAAPACCRRAPPPIAEAATAPADAAADSDAAAGSETVNATAADEWKPAWATSSEDDSESAAEGEAAAAEGEAAAAEDESAAAASKVTIKAPKPATPEESIQSVVASWPTADSAAKASGMSKLARLAKDFDVNQDPKQFKEALIGSWKLVAADDADAVSTAGLSGFAAKPFGRVAGQFQAFSKPDPMDIFSGGAKDKFFMETSEVVVDAKEGSASLATLKGGFQVLPPGANSELGVVEYYSRRERDGAVESAEAEVVAPNRWACTFLSATFRVCRMANGKLRVYEKVSADEAAAELQRLQAQDVAVDADAVAAWEEEQRLAREAAAADDEDEDDPNDTRPMWQKRIDKADGIKRTKNGTPIINHGPIGGGGGPPRTQ